MAKQNNSKTSKGNKKVQSESTSSGVPEIKVEEPVLEEEEVIVPESNETFPEEVEPPLVTETSVDDAPPVAVIVPESLPVEETVQELVGFAKVAKPATDQERQLVTLIDSYIEISNSEKSRASDGINKLKLLVSIFAFPITSRVGDPSFMFDIIEKFIIQERRHALAESFVAKHANELTELTHKEFINMYVTMVTLVDCKQNRKLKFRLNIDSLGQTLGVKYQKFVNWVTIKANKLNK